MPTAQPDRIVCEGCRRSGPYKPELAGKKIKCKCGHIMRVPVARSAAPMPAKSVPPSVAPPEPVEAADEEIVRPQPLDDEEISLDDMAAAVPPPGAVAEGDADSAARTLFEHLDLAGRFYGPELGDRGIFER